MAAIPSTLAPTPSFLTTPAPPAGAPSAAPAATPAATPSTLPALPGEQSASAILGQLMQMLSMLITSAPPAAPAAPAAPAKPPEPPIPPISITAAAGFDFFAKETQTALQKEVGDRFLSQEDIELEIQKYAPGQEEEDETMYNLLVNLKLNFADIAGFDELIDAKEIGAIVAEPA
jgi:hypothetical protein